jgi:hypothetical protein
MRVLTSLVVLSTLALSACTTAPLGNYVRTTGTVLTDSQALVHVCREKSAGYALLNVDLLIDEQRIASISQGSNTQLVTTPGKKIIVLYSNEYRQPRFLSQVTTLERLQERYFVLGVNLDNVAVLPTPLIIFGTRSDRWTMKEVDATEFARFCDGIEPTRLTPKK